MMSVLSAFVAAVLIQPLVFAAHMSIEMIAALMAGLNVTIKDIQELGIVSIFVLVVAAIFVLVLGLPLFLTLKRFNRLNWVSIALAGFAAAALPYALYSWPLSRDMPGSYYGGNWYGHYVEFVKDGVHTIYGWLSFAEGTLWFGIHGVVGAIVFYWVWLRFHKPQPAVPADANASRYLRG